MIAPRALSVRVTTYFSKHPVPRIVRNHRESYQFGRRVGAIRISAQDYAMLPFR